MKWNLKLGAALGVVLTLGCDALPSGTSAAEPAEKVLSQLKSFGLSVKGNNLSAPNQNEPWHIFFTTGVQATRHVSPQSAEDYCWVQINKNEPHACVTTGGWSITWSADTPPAIAEKLKQF